MDQAAELSAASQGSASGDELRRILSLRHEAGAALVQAADGAEFVDPDPGALPPYVDGLPEIEAADLTAGLLRAGMLRDGAVLVRGLIPREEALEIARRIDEVFDDRELFHRSLERPNPVYEEFMPAPPYEPIESRLWVREGGGVLAADCPAIEVDMQRIFAAAGIQRLATEYLGEPPVVSADKTTLRRADPSVAGGWHQDGNFMGAVRALNLWVSLSRCGDVAPGLDLVPRRLDDLVVSGTEEAALGYVVAESRAQEAAGDRPVVRPIFEPGDAVFFDEMNLHKTASDPAMPNQRFAIENWFFGPSSFPEEYVPIAV